MSQNVTQRPKVVDMPPWGVCVFESHHGPGFRMETSRHEPLEVFYVLAGQGVFELAGRPVPCAAEDVIVVPVNQPHRFQDDPAHPLSLFGLRIRPDVWKKIPDLDRQLPAGKLARNKVISAQVRIEFRHLLFEQTSRRTGYAGTMVGLALQVLTLLARSQGSSEAETVVTRKTALHRQTIEKYVEELAHQFYEQTKIDNVARRLGLSRRRFTELFREITGTTWLEYVHRLRVNHAKQLLCTTDRSVTSIAFEAGFEDLSSFYRAFHREAQTTPQRWRQAHVQPS
jgi:AraC family L-rhamnose operon regulatory protein RhaS